MNIFSPKTLKNKNDVNLSRVDNLSFEDIKALLIQQLYPVRFKIANEQDEDVLAYDVTKPVNEKWTNKPVGAFVKDRLNVFTKTQSWGGGLTALVTNTPYTDPAPAWASFGSGSGSGQYYSSIGPLLTTNFGVIKIPKTGNHFNIDVTPIGITGTDRDTYAPDANTKLFIEDIMYSDGTPIAVGTILSFNFTDNKQYPAENKYEHWRHRPRLTRRFKMDFTTISGDISTPVILSHLTSLHAFQGALSDSLAQTSLYNKDHIVFQKVAPDDWEIMCYQNFYLRHLHNIEVRPITYRIAGGKVNIGDVTVRAVGAPISTTGDIKSANYTFGSNINDAFFKVYLPDSVSRGIRDTGIIIDTFWAQASIVSRRGTQAGIDADNDCTVTIGYIDYSEPTIAVHFSVKTTSGTLVQDIDVQMNFFTTNRFVCDFAY